MFCLFVFVTAAMISPPTGIGLLESRKGNGSAQSGGPGETTPQMPRVEKCLKEIVAEKPMVADATFWVALMTQPITATALMMFVNDWKIYSLAIQRPNFENQGGSDGASIRRDFHNVAATHL